MREGKKYTQKRTDRETNKSKEREKIEGERVK